jgi:hypothetical protein
VRHVHVQAHEVERVLAEEVHGLATVLGRRDREALEQMRDELAHGLSVVGDERAERSACLAGLAHGKSM